MPAEVRSRFFDRHRGLTRIVQLGTVECFRKAPRTGDTHERGCDDTDRASMPSGPALGSCRRARYGAARHNRLAGSGTHEVRNRGRRGSGDASTGPGR